jgi:hypothetical protein
MLFLCAGVDTSLDEYHARLFLEESFDDILIPDFEIDLVRTEHEGYIHAIAEAIMKVEENSFYYVNSNERRGFAFTILRPKTYTVSKPQSYELFSIFRCMSKDPNEEEKHVITYEDHSNRNEKVIYEMEEKYFNFEDLGPSDSIARKLLKSTLHTTLEKQVRQKMLTSDDADLIIQIGESLTNHDAKIAIENYNNGEVVFIEKIMMRGTKNDHESLNLYQILDESIPTGTFHRTNRMKFLSEIWNQNYLKVKNEFDSYFKSK